MAVLSSNARRTSPAFINSSSSTTVFFGGQHGVLGLFRLDGKAGLGGTAGEVACLRGRHGDARAIKYLSNGSTSWRA